MKRFHLVVGYWLDLDPFTKQEKQSKGIVGDRSELSLFEKYFAYGFKLETTDEKSDIKKMTVAACPHIPIFLGSQMSVLNDNSNIHEEDKQIHAFVNLEGTLCRLESIFVNMTGPVFTPTISSVELRGTNLITKEKKLCIMNKASL